MDIEISGDHAFIVTSTDFEVWDISDPASIVQLSRLPMQHGSELAMYGTHAVVADRDEFQLIDVSDAANPVIASTLKLPVSRVTVSGDYAIAAAGNGAVFVVDISTPSTPVLLNQAYTTGSAYGLDVANGHAFLASWTMGLTILPIHTAQAPARIGHLDTPATGVDVSGDYAYIGALDALNVTDISTPRAPAIAASVPLSGSVNDVVVSGDHAYIAQGGDDNLLVVDIGDPLHPVVVGDAGGLDGTPLELSISFPYAFVVGQSRFGRRIFDISVPEAPRQIGVFPEDPQMSTTAVHVYDGKAFAGFVTDPVFQIIDVLSPARPTLIGRLDELDRDIAGIRVSGDYAYLSYLGGLQVVNIGNPSTPELSGSAPFNVWTQNPAKVLVRDGYAFVATDHAIEVVDIATPTNPTPRLAIPLPKGANDLAGDGEFVYATSSYDGLHIIDPFACE